MHIKKIIFISTILLILIVPITNPQAPIPLKKTENAIILTNSIDYELNKWLFDFLAENNIKPIQANADNFSNYYGEKFIIILGGPEAPEGIGEIVQTKLTSKEQAFLKSDLNARKMFIKNYIGPIQNIMILAGRTRMQTQLVVNENNEKIVDYIIPVVANINIEEIRTKYDSANKATFLDYIIYTISNKGERIFDPTIDLEILNSTGGIVYENTNIENLHIESEPSLNWWDNVSFEVKFDPGIYNVTLKLRREDFPGIIARNTKTMLVE